MSARWRNSERICDGAIDSAEPTTTRRADVQPSGAGLARSYDHVASEAGRRTDPRPTSAVERSDRTRSIEQLQLRFLAPSSGCWPCLAPRPTIADLARRVVASSAVDARNGHDRPRYRRQQWVKGPIAAGPGSPKLKKAACAADESGVMADVQFAPPLQRHGLTLACRVCASATTTAGSGTPGAAGRCRPVAATAPAPVQAPRLSAPVPVDPRHQQRPGASRCTS